MDRGRVPRPVRRMGTEIHADRRTRRRRTRAQQEAAAFDEEDTLLTSWILSNAQFPFAEDEDDEDDWPDFRAPRRRLR